MSHLYMFLLICLAICFGIEARYTVPLSYAAKYEGQAVGSGQYKGECAAGVQTIFANYYGSSVLGLTSSWKKGNKVASSTTPPGTAIACFRYSNSYSSGHAAIFIRHESNGIRVWDQWQGQPWHQRTIRCKSGSGFDVNNCYCFYEIA